MEIYFEVSFEKDLKKIKDKVLLQEIKNRILEAKCTSNIWEIRHIKKLKGYETFYRIRVGAYCLGIEVIHKKVIFTRCIHRKDIYRYFPKR